MDNQPAPMATQAPADAKAMAGKESLLPAQKNSVGSGLSGRGGNLRAHFDSLAPKRAKYVRMNALYYRDLLTLLDHVVPHDAKVVELGCGIGTVTQRLKNKDKTGVDFSPEMIRIAKERDASTTYLVDDIDALKTEGNYDYVLLLDTINSLHDVQSALVSIRSRLCTDRSRIIITFYNFLWEPLLRFAEMLRLKTPLPNQSWFAKADVRMLLGLAGYEVVTDGERLLLPVDIPLVSWLLNTFFAKLPLIRKLCLVQYVIARPLPKERKNPTVSIVIAARNEEGNIERAITTMPSFAPRQQIIFVEGGSKDKTWEKINEIAEKYKGTHDILPLKQTAKGLANAYHTAFKNVTGELIMILNGDLTVDPSELPKFYEAICSGHGEFINGSRLVYPMEKKAMPLFNMIFNKCFGVLLTFLIGQRLKDTLCGTKVLLTSDLRKIEAQRSYFGDFDPFGDFELLFGAAKQNMKIIDLPVRYKDRTYGETNIRRWYHGWMLLKMCGVAARKLKFW